MIKHNKKHKGQGRKGPLPELVAIALLAPAAAHAYIDPGIGAAVITAILGAFGAISYTLRNYIEKIKSFFKGNKDKQVEDR